jgi:hypothetical protein
MKLQSILLQALKLAQWRWWIPAFFLTSYFRVREQLCSKLRMCSKGQPSNESRDAIIPLRQSGPIGA